MPSKCNSPQYTYDKKTSKLQYRLRKYWKCHNRTLWYKKTLKVCSLGPDGHRHSNIKISAIYWLCWRSLNRLLTWVGRAKTVMRRWGYLDDAQSVDCDCGEPQTMAHLLSCHLLDKACTADDLTTVTKRAKACARKWEKIV